MRAHFLSECRTAVVNISVQGGEAERKKLRNLGSLSLKDQGGFEKSR